MPLRQHLLTLLKLTLLGSAGIVCAGVLYILVSLVISPISRGRALEAVGLDSLADILGPDKFSQRANVPTIFVTLLSSRRITLQFPIGFWNVSGSLRWTLRRTQSGPR
jgi:hypothetical protein